MSEREPRPPVPQPQQPEHSEDLSKGGIWGESNPMEHPLSIETEAGTFAWYTDKGIGYPKDENQDVVVIKPSVTGFAVLDGIGGREGGGYAAQIHGANLFEALGDISKTIEAHRKTTRELSQSQHKKAGTCYLAASIHEGSMYIFQAGDVRLQAYIADGRAGLSTKDQAIGNKVQSHVSGDIFDTQAYVDHFRIAPYARIIIASDGIWKNYSADELSGLTLNQSPLDAANSIRKSLLSRMQRKVDNKLTENEHVDCDNFGFVIFDPKK